jgi:hypothetical protein
MAGLWPVAGDRYPSWGFVASERTVSRAKGEGHPSYISYARRRGNRLDSPVHPAPGRINPEASWAVRHKPYVIAAQSAENLQTTCHIVSRWVRNSAQELREQETVRDQLIAEIARLRSRLTEVCEEILAMRRFAKPAPRRTTYRGERP